MARHGENIYKRKDNRWEARLRVGRNEKGEPVYKSIYGASYLECKQKIKALLFTPVEEPQLHPAFKGFGRVSREWLQSIKPMVKESTFSAYTFIVERYIKKYFFQRDMNDINEEIVAYFVRMLMQCGGKKRQCGLSVRTVNNIMSVVRSIFKYAEKQYGVKNPTRDLRMPQEKATQDSVLTVSEWEALSRGMELRGGSTEIAVAIAMYTGMRIGELCALQVGDIDLEEKIIHVRRTVQRIRDAENPDGRKTRVITDVPKSYNSLRKIPIPEVLYEKLERLCAGKQDNVFLFGIDGDRALEPRTLQYRYKTFLKQRGLRYIKFHALRHSFATRCVERNVDVKTLSEILGHSSVKITLERYVHSSMEFKRHQINRLNEAI